MNRAVRSSGAIVLAFLASLAFGQVGGRIGVSLARAPADPWGVAAVGVATLFILVPAVAGLVLGIAAP